MDVNLAYGRGQVTVSLPGDITRVIHPSHLPGLRDERKSLIEALKAPIQSEPLLKQIRPDDHIVITFTDITRATPNARLIPWILEHLGDHPKDQITLINQLGTHRPNTRAELEMMLTPEVVANYRVINHDCEDESKLVQVGTTTTGAPALLNKTALDADLRIVTGFIEPHFFAGFSGGPKGLMPGVAGLKTVMSNHGAHHINDPNSTFGITHGNPLWEELLRIAKLAGPSFLVNVTLNEERDITGVYAGDLEEAHREGCKVVRQSAMQDVDEPFDIVITTNSGYPLDMNLYQGVKGMSAGARILKEGGLLILACECEEGVPSGSPMDQLLREALSPEELLTMMASPGFERPEQWQAQIQALVQRKADVRVFCSLPDETLLAAHLTPCHDISKTVEEHLSTLGNDARIAVLPQGPLTIPTLSP